VKYIFLCLFVFVVFKKDAQTIEPIIDKRDGFSYKTVQIGSQIWMAENLNSSTFRNGDIIPEVRTYDGWIESNHKRKPAWCYYNYDSLNGKIYGKIYNWYAVNDSRGLAPEGWHVSTNEEWTELIQFLGVENAGIKMKSNELWRQWSETKPCVNCQNWTDIYFEFNICPKCFNKKYIEIQKINGGGTNESGFLGLPGGSCDGNGYFYYSKGIEGSWWSSNEQKSGSVRCYSLIYNFNSLNSGFLGKAMGNSVRCVKD
jgi:uncharacterized protein (TIGR02145 family)